MLSVSLNMMFWTDGLPDKTRDRNVAIAWPEMNKLADFLRKNNITAECNMYDFSVEPVLDYATHIPYPQGTYKRAEKANTVLKRANGDYFMLFDCDCFFRSSDYSKLLELFKTIHEKQLHTFDAMTPQDTIGDIFEGDNRFNEQYVKTWWYSHSGLQELGPLANGMKAGLGGVYIINTRLFLNNGGYNERFTVWGGEDGEAMSMLTHKISDLDIRPNRDFAPIHLPHDRDIHNISYFGDEQEQQRIKGTEYYRYR